MTSVTEEMIEAACEEAGWIVEPGAFTEDDAEAQRIRGAYRAGMRSILAAALSASPAAQTEDWVLVPREPTEAMLDAGVKDQSEDVSYAGAEAVYAAMLAAAPSAPQPTELVVVKIKPLEWLRIENDQMLGGVTAIAQSALGQYQAWGTGQWTGPNVGHVMLRGSLEDGMAAAQADYNARILSALASPLAQQRDEVIE